MITASQVKEILGETSHNIGQLCSSSNINKWSFYKPVSLVKTSSLEDSDWYSVDDGFTNIAFSSPFNLIQNLSQGWQYNPPSRYLRLGDFRGYNHNATRWFEAELVNGSTIEIGSTLRISFSDDLQWLYNFNSFDSSMDFGFLVLTSLNANSFYYYKVPNIADLDSEKISLPINSPLSIGTYYAIPIMTSQTNFVSGQYHYINQNTSLYGSWLMLPTPPIQFTVQQSQPPQPPSSQFTLTVENGSFSYGTDSDGEYVSNIEFDLVVSLDSNYTGNPKSYSINVVFKNAYEYGSITDVEIGSMSGTISGGESHTNSFSYINRIHYLAGDVYDRLPLTAIVQLDNTDYEQTIIIEYQYE